MLADTLAERIAEIRKRQVARGNANDRWYVDDIDFLLTELERQEREIAELGNERRISGCALVDCPMQD